MYKERQTKDQNGKNFIQKGVFCEKIWKHMTILRLEGFFNKFSLFSRVHLNFLFFYILKDF